MNSNAYLSKVSYEQEKFFTPGSDQPTAITIPDDKMDAPSYQGLSAEKQAVAVPAIPLPRKQQVVDVDKTDDNTDGQDSWTWWMTVWNVFACIVCPACICLTLPAVVLNILAYADYMSGDQKKKQWKIRNAFILSMVSFLAGIVAAVIILVVLILVYNALSWNTVPALPGYDYLM